MAPEHTGPSDILRRIRWPLRLTWWGMLAERLTRAFWPLWSVLFVVLAALMLGLQDEFATEWVWGAGALALLAALWTGYRGLRAFRWPSRDGALARLDGTLKGNPIQAAFDTQAIGARDAASLAVWRAHQDRMRARLAQARAAQPDLRVSDADPFALRYVALLALSVAILFGSIMRVQSVTSMGAGGPELAQGPSWEGWMQPPSYTRQPSIYLNDITAPAIDVPEGAQITLRMYGEVGDLSVEETVSGRPLDTEGSTQDTAQDFEVARSGQLAIDGPGGRAWRISMIPDEAPAVSQQGEIETSYEGEAQIPYAAQDDHAVTAGTARITLALSEVPRRYALAAEPEPRPAIEMPLPMPVTGDRAEFTETITANFSQHPWANLPVRLELEVEDDRGQTGLSQPTLIDLPGRNFFDPTAATVIEQRQAVLWNRDNTADAALLLRAVMYDAGDLFRTDVNRLRVEHLVQRMELLASYGMSDEQLDELAQDMWDLALTLEEGDLADALERLQRAQDRLNEAMKNGASDQEIAELMQELRRATDDYLRQLSREQQQNPNAENQMTDQNMMEMSQNDLQEMMDRIQELMEQGRMAEAQEALEQLRQMMENMQVTQGQGGQGQSPGEQAMEGLSETLRDQQELSDEAFRDLQEQFNPGQQGQEGQQGEGGQQQGQSQGQGEGRGQQEGQGQGQGQGQGTQQGQNGQGGQTMQDSLEERQRALRDELGRQRRNLPGQNSEAGQRAGEALGRAEDAMDGAAEALRDGDLPEAIDRQSDAMEALREGMRDLGESMAQQQQHGQGQQGTAQGGEPGQQRDPLGRNAGSNGQLGSDEGMLQGEDVYRRARDLLEELRRRSGEGDRPTAELDYLERLLDRF